MDKYVWLFPVLFIFHDMEEIIGFRIWFEHNKDFIDKKFPVINKISDNYSTEGMAVAVFEELILCILICIISIVTQWYGLWLGGFITYAIHLLIHIGQSTIIRKYIPALATSFICLPASVYIIKKSIDILEYGSNYILILSFIGMSIVLINLKFAHTLMHKFNKLIGQ